MLVIRKYKEKEKKEILDLLISEKINDLDLGDYIYVAIEDDVIIGVCKIKVKDNEGFLKYILVKESNRGKMLGNSILRVMFNNLEKNNVEKIYFSEIDPYLLKIGFIENDDNKLEINLSELFKAGCNCSVKCSEHLE